MSERPEHIAGVSIRRVGQNDEVAIALEYGELPNFEASIALSLIEKWGTVAAKPDGEDTAGRAKLGLQTPEEIVERSCKTAELAAAEFRKRGWMVAVPTVEAATNSLNQREVTVEITPRKKLWR